MAGSRVFGTRLACLMAFALLLVGVQSASASPSDQGAPSRARYADADGDGIGDEIDPDDDNDGVLDIDEVTGPDPTTPPEIPDADGDGIPDDLDPDDDNDGVPDDQGGNDPDPAADADGDGISDALDPDDDNDGIADEDEIAAPGPTPGDRPTSPGTNDNPASAPGGESALISGLPVTGSGTGSTSSWIDSALIGFVVAVAGLPLILVRRRHFSSSGAGPRAS